MAINTFHDQRMEWLSSTFPKQWYHILFWNFNSKAPAGGDRKWLTVQPPTVRNNWREKKSSRADQRLLHFDFDLIFFPNIPSHFRFTIVFYTLGKRFGISYYREVFSYRLSTRLNLLFIFFFFLRSCNRSRCPRNLFSVCQRSGNNLVASRIRDIEKIVLGQLESANCKLPPNEEL